MIKPYYKDQIQTAIDLVQTKDFDKLITIVKKLIDEYPDDFFLENFYGTILLNIKQYDLAEKYLNLSIINNKEYSPAYYNLGLLLFYKKEYEDAVKNFLFAAELDKENYQTLLHIALSYEFLGLDEKAIFYFLKLLEFDSFNEEILYKITSNYLKKNDYLNAILYLSKCQEINSKNFKYLYLLGWLYYKTRDFNKSLVYYKQALRIKQTTETYHGIGLVYKELRLLDLASENYEKCLIIDPNYLPALNNLASIKMIKNDVFSSIEYLEKCVKLDSTSSNILLNMARAQFSVLNFKQGLKYFEESFKNDFSKENFEKYLFSTLYIENFDIKKYLDLAQGLSNFLNKNKIQNYKIDLANNNLIIGFVSGDFREHAVAYQISGVLKELKNFSDIKLYAYSNNDYEDDKTKEFKNIFNKFDNIFNCSDDYLIKKIVEDKVNILIDLSGYSSLNRLSVFLAKPAPIQMIAFGYAQTTGLKEVDYFLADQKLIINERNYSEKVLKMPHVWSTLDTNDINFEVGDLPAKVNKYVIFGVFNNFSKLNEKMLKSWSEILKGNSNSKILFNNYSYNDLGIKNYIYSSFEKNKIDKSRILVENGGNRNKILKDFNKIDILLDTYPYGAGTISLEAAWMCVPLLTISGDNFVSRGATSVNLSLGMPEWNCDTHLEYEIKAIKFSNNIDLLMKIKQHLIEQRENEIFNNSSFAKHFYSLLRNVWKEYLQNNKI